MAEAGIMSPMARLISKVDRVAKQGLEQKFLTAQQSSDVQQMGSYAEQMMQVIAQARAASDAWRTPTEAAEMRKLARMLTSYKFGAK